MNPDAPGGAVRFAGVAHAAFAFDLGFSIDLDAARAHLDSGDRPRVLRLRRPAPDWFEYRRPPLRAIAHADPITLGAWTTDSEVGVLVHEFGGASITVRVPFNDEPEALVRLSGLLYDNPELARAARRQAESLLDTIRDSVERPSLSDIAEDYMVLSVTDWGGVGPEELIARHRARFAAILLAEGGELSEEQVARALSGRLGYSPMDAAIIDWNAAILFDAEPEDVIALLTHANVELLEMRLLDDQLGRLLERAHTLLARQSRRSIASLGVQARERREFAEVQTDAALLFEGVDNAIKLAGDQYLARLYRLAGERLHLASWDAGVLRKLATADSVYQKLADVARDRRMELLEIIIILLILISLFTPLIPGLGH